ncbi:MAG: hypothetical protein D6761_04760 [Candidatus Dadabacteria bacterium]|nr:MAG: hypothetical protein D6761_04760 [Candidatus Dadabacteria bacterium]
MTDKAPPELCSAADILERILFQEAWLDPLLRAQRRRGISASVRRRCEYYCRTVLEHERGLRVLLRGLLKRPDRRVQPRVEVLLLLGLARLLFTEAPAFAVVDETVSALPRRHYARGFVNAVLRRAAGQCDALRERYGTLSPDLRWSVPAFWLAELERALGGSATVDAALAGLRRSPGTHIVVSDEVRRELLEKGVHLEPVAGGAAWRITGNPATFWSLMDDAEKAPTLQIQDGGIAAWLCTVQATAPGRRVWDAFCAPGGKLCSLARAGFDVLGTDRSEARLRMVQNALRSAGCSAELGQLDIDEALPDGSYDLVLADVPCSASGTLGRHPEVALRSDPDAVVRLQRQQCGWLARVAERVAPGGVLWYSTCSLFPGENEDVVDAFLEQHPEFARLRVQHPLTSEETEVLRFWPHRDELAGFTAQALVRQNLP